jgi:hypothetical protein
MKFPANPSHNMIFEAKEGMLFRYDSTINSWVEIEPESAGPPTATVSKSGLMSSADFDKLKKLTIPPVQSSITGNRCFTVFTEGIVELKGGDEFVKVQGSLDVSNVDRFGDVTEENVPFNIHGATYGFNFLLDIPALVKELRARNQFNPIGPTGQTGKPGPVGDPGEETVLSGPKGLKGEAGQNFACDLTIETENIDVEIQGSLRKVLTNARVVFDEEDPLKYYIEFDRQEVGKQGISADRFMISREDSPWLISASFAGNNRASVKYCDVEPILTILEEKYKTEVDYFKGRYERTVKWWIETMSRVFEEQKAALCCAIACCKSRTANAQSRKHIESIASSALPNKLNVQFVDGKPQCPTPQPSSASVAALGDQLLSNIDEPKQDANLFRAYSASFINSAQPLDDISVEISSSKINWFENSWKSGRSCGVVVRLAGQDYIIFKRSIGDDYKCGGGEVASEPYIANFISHIGHPAIAWPTFDGKTFAPINSDKTIFRYDLKMNSLLEQEFNKGNFVSLRGELRELNKVLFPIML